MNDIPVRVAGIPAIARVTHYFPGAPGRINGPPEICYPSEDPELDFDLLDRRGRPAPWLERKLDDPCVSEDVCEQVMLALIDPETY